jgi:uncharacterized protein HemY
MQLAILDLEAGHPRLAASGLEEARGELGDRPELLNALGESYSRMNEVPKALVVLRKSLAIDPNQPTIRTAIEKLDKQ